MSRLQYSEGTRLGMCCQLVQKEFDKLGIAIKENQDKFKENVLEMISLIEEIEHAYIKGKEKIPEQTLKHGESTHTTPEPTEEVIDTKTVATEGKDTYKF